MKPFYVIQLKTIALILALQLSSCGKSITQIEQVSSMGTDTVSYKILGRTNNNQIFIESEINLNGCICLLPKEFVLKANGGVLRNGTIIGNDTKIDGTDTLFDHIIIKGTWNVPYITTKLFANLDYENSLRDVVALANPRIRNRIVIGKGIYYVRTEKESDICISLCSNTDFILEGTIKLLPNDNRIYSIVKIEGNNIVVKGHGTIVGDKYTHIGTTGEWGMGVNIVRGYDVTLSGITVKDCWGDCIYVGRRSNGVLIENCLLDNGRRQGVSVTNAERVTIRKCEIMNVSVTPPQYAIDIEPNANDTCDNIIIDNVKVFNCKGGFLVYGKAKNAFVGNVIIRKSYPSGDGKIALNVIGCEKVVVEKCKILQKNSMMMISCRDVNDVVIKNNSLHRHIDIGGKLKTVVSNIVKGNNLDYLSLENCGNTFVDNNAWIK